MFLRTVVRRPAGVVKAHAGTVGVRRYAWAVTLTVCHAGRVESRDDAASAAA